MDHETKSQLVTAGMILQQKQDELTRRQIEVVGSAFEMMMVLSPEIALEVITQLNEQINEETVEEMLREREEHFEKLKGLVIK